MRAPRSRRALRLIWRAHRLIWNVSGGRLGRTTIGMPVLELVTTGHRSGDPKSILITYLNLGSGVAVAGSNSGAARDPAWIQNLRAHPDARVRDAGKWRDVRARFLDGPERAGIWETFKEFPDYASYEQMTERVIPVVVLEPATRT